MGLRSRALLAGGVGFAAAFAVACGSTSGLLSSDQNGTLTTQLDAISSAVSSGNCQAAQSASQQLTAAISKLPASVSNKLLQNLGQGAATVNELALRDCSSTSATTSHSSTTPSSSSTTSSTSTITSTVTTSTSTPSTSTNQTVTSTATNSSTPGTTSTGSGGAGVGNGNGNGGGNGNGNGNPNGNGNGNGNG